jgi:hypothetical protein
MISCADRDAVRGTTLQSLAATDWGDQPVHIEMDRSTAERRQERQEQTARLALQRGLEGEVDYLLFLEDDLEFNRHLRHNLANWKPLKEGWVTLASIYNPNIGWWQWEREDHYLVADPNTIYGSHAFIVSRAATEFIVERWHELPGMQDIKMSRLAASLGKPLYYHVPSLVQHVGENSVWGGWFHQSCV